MCRKPSTAATLRAPLGALLTAVTLGNPAFAQSPPPAAAASAPAAAASAPAPPRPSADTPPLRPFADVVREAKRSDGLIPLWRKDERVWLEIAPDRLNKPMLVSVNVGSSVGERGLYGGQMGPRWLAEFRKVGNQMHLLARNVQYRGERDPASQRAVRDSFSDSLIGAAAVASAAHPQSKAVLVDASFLLGDMARYSTLLENAFRLPFAPDRANSYFEDVRTEPALTTLAAKIHYAVPRIPAPPLLPPGAPVPPQTPAPSTTPDPRSLFVGFVFNFRELPAQAMVPRRADPRVGHFVDSHSDLSDDLKPDPRVHLVQRWRLEKKDPQAALSEPVQPITFWLDRNIPQRYRASVEAGVLEWNKAFERAGFKNALVAKQQGDEAAFDTLDAKHASVRWFVGADAGFAIGPRHTDPRSGEILDADIGMSDVFGRGARRMIREDYALAARSAALRGLESLWQSAHDAQCSYALDGAFELGFALDLLEARGDLAPDDPQVEEFVQAYVKDTIMHEVGHALGLRHNFKASTTVSFAQLRDGEYGRTNGVSGSVMDYNAFNLALAGEPRGVPNMSTLGPYDYWAIEYAYKPIDGTDEAAELERIAARGQTDPTLAYADDVDAGFAGSGLDPLANRFDLGDDPLEWAKRRLALSKELWARVQERGSRSGDDPQRTRRTLLAGFRQVSMLPEMASKYVGGMHTARDLPGSGARPNFRPVEPAKQREALRFLNDTIFGADSFRFRPEFVATLVPDYVDFARSGPVSIAQAVLQMQTGTLDRLLGAGTAARLLELPHYLGERERRGAISLHEVYSTVQGAVWSELKSAREIEPMRRSLQREHLRRVQALLTRPSAATPADAVSLTRLLATELQADLRRALQRKDLAVENRAHLQESLAVVTEALRAGLLRAP
jgi:hypothetical protein